MDERKRREWLKVATIFVLVAVCIFATVWFHYVSDTGYVFPHIYYIPIILACLWWDRKGIAVAAFLAAFLVISSAFSSGTQPLWDDLIRAGVFLVVAVVIAELSARRKGLIDNLEERVAERTAELRASNEELEAFSRTVSHDLIGSLSTLRGYAEVAQDAAAGENRGLEAESLDAIESIGMRMSNNIRELLDYARAGKHEGPAEPVSSSYAAGEVIEELGGLMSGRRIEVSVDEKLPDVLVEEVKLKQVFSNLVTNSIKHGAGNGPLRIEIGGYMEGDTAVLFVRDDGVGIESEWQDEIFGDFKRMNRGGETPGLGLGLSIVKRAVEGWDGRLWLESAPGEGAAFFFTAPTQT